MKLLVRVILNNEEREFDISCGEGDVSFKWLASAGMQRWAQAVPKGNLRRCDLKHGVSDTVQYSTTNVLLTSGEIPHPDARLKEFLRSGDQVIVNLIGNQQLNILSGLPKRSAWNTVAFTRTISLEDSEQEISDVDSDEVDLKYDDDSQVVQILDSRVQMKSKVRSSENYTVR
jgi:hypothetical protein